MSSIRRALSRFRHVLPLRLTSFFSDLARRKRRPDAPPRALPGLELLEDRTLLTIQFAGPPVIGGPTFVHGSPLSPPNNAFHDLRLVPASQIAAHRTVIFGINGQLETARGTACRGADGTWTAVS